MNVKLVRQQIMSQKFKHVNKQNIYYSAMYTLVLNCAANLIDFLHVQVLYLLDDCRKLYIEYLEKCDLFDITL